MSNDKEKLGQLSTRVDELLGNINKVTEELRSISTSIKLLSEGQNQPKQTTATPIPVTLKPIDPPQTTTPTTTVSMINTSATVQTGTNLRTLDDVRMSFPEELETELDFEDKGDYMIIKPKQFLGSEKFAKTASAIRGMGGEYISAGKDSHFRVPKKKE